MPLQGKRTRSPRWSVKLYAATLLEQSVINLAQGNSEENWSLYITEHAWVPRKVTLIENGQVHNKPQEVVEIFNN